MRNTLLGLIGLVAIASGCGGNDVNSVTSPILVAGTTAESNWSGSAGSGRIKLVVVAPDSTETTVAADIADTGTTSWRVPLLPPGDGYRIEARDADDNTIIDVVADNMTTAALASISWNPALSVEEYGWLDLGSGSVATLGPVGDLQAWQGEAAFDGASGKVFVIGRTDFVAPPTLYTLNSRTGELVSSLPLPGSDITGVLVNDTGELLGVHVATGTLTLVAIDTNTGTVTPRGTITAGSIGWQKENAIDRVANRVYALAQEFEGESMFQSVHVLDASTGALISSAPVLLDGAPTSDLNGLQVAADGALIACRWSGSAEEVMRLDPATGTATSIGQVGDLQSWQTQTAVDPSTGAYYVFGTGADDAPHLYVLDSVSGALLGRTDIAALPAAALVVY